MITTIEWLLQGPAWVRYGTLADLMQRDPDDPGTIAARREMLEDTEIAGLLRELATWPGSPMKGHNEAGHLLHKLTFIAAVGLKVGDPGVAALADRVLAHRPYLFAMGTDFRKPKAPFVWYDLLHVTDVLTRLP